MNKFVLLFAISFVFISSYGADRVIEAVSPWGSMRAKADGVVEAVSPCRRRLAVTVPGKLSFLVLNTLPMWGRTQSTQTFTQLDGEAPITQLAWCSDNRLVTGHKNGDIYVWNTNEPAAGRTKYLWHDAAITALAFISRSFVGDSFASGDERGCIVLWPLAKTLQSAGSSPAITDLRVENNTLVATVKGAPPITLPLK